MNGIRFRDLTHLLSQMHGSNTYVNVWNCQAEFVIGGIYESDFEENLTEEQSEALEKLKEYIIYTVNDGAINISGMYQLDDIAYEVLRLILENEIEDALEIISQPGEEDFREKAEELISEMDEGDYAIVRDSALDYGCWDGCQGYHNRQYVAMLNEKLVLVDNGDAHHAYSNAPIEIIKELTEDEAVEMLTEFIKQFAERYNYTKAELENFMLDSEFDGKMHICEKHNEIYFDYEECQQCYDEHFSL